MGANEYKREPGGRGEPSVLRPPRPPRAPSAPTAHRPGKRQRDFPPTRGGSTDPMLCPAGAFIVPYRNPDYPIIQLIHLPLGHLQG